MHRYSDQVRERIENHLNMILRADPAGARGANVCRVYSPGVNTQDKLRKLSTTLLQSDAASEIQLSNSALQRMINNYLDVRNLRTAFKQMDHNACPNCKTANLAIRSGSVSSRRQNGEVRD